MKIIRLLTTAMLLIVMVGAGLGGGLTVLVTAQTQTAAPPPATPGPTTTGERDILTQVFSFLYTIAHGIGLLVVKAIQAIIPEADVLNSLIDPIGVLALLTIFLAIYELAKKITWIIVIVGWALIVIKIVLVVLHV